MGCPNTESPTGVSDIHPYELCSRPREGFRGDKVIVRDTRIALVKGLYQGSILVWAPFAVTRSPYQTGGRYEVAIRSAEDRGFSWLGSLKGLRRIVTQVEPS